VWFVTDLLDRCMSERFGWCEVHPREFVWFVTSLLDRCTCERFGSCQVHALLRAEDVRDLVRDRFTQVSADVSDLVGVKFT